MSLGSSDPGPAWGLQPGLLGPRDPWAASQVLVVLGIKEKKDLGVSPSPCVRQQGFLDQSMVHLLQEPRLEADLVLAGPG